MRIREDSMRIDAPGHNGTRTHTEFAVAREHDGNVVAVVFVEM